MKDNIYKWFDIYTSTYLESVDASVYELKYKHTLQVASNCSKIAIEEGFNNNESEIAEIIGILHDCGRFEQYRQFRTFNDRDSVDHAELSVKVIMENNLIKDSTPTEQEIIIQSVLQHNKKEIINNQVSNKTLSFIKLIRDADKTDIFRVMKEQLKNPEFDKKTLLLNQSDEILFSAPIIESIRNKELANLKDMKTMVDFRLIQLSWVFDINYNSTICIIRNQGHLKWLIDNLPGQEMIKDELTLIKNELQIA